MFSTEPITCATLDSTKGSFTYLVDEGKTAHNPGGLLSHHDNGPRRRHRDSRRYRRARTDEDGLVNGKEVTGGGPDLIREALARDGLEPDDVYYVILMHLHYDHVPNIDLFPEAEFFVQESELAAARNPLPPVKQVYDADILDELAALETTIVDGGYASARESSYATRRVTPKGVSRSSSRRLRDPTPLSATWPTANRTSNLVTRPSSTATGRRSRRRPSSTTTLPSAFTSTCGRATRASRSSGTASERTERSYPVTTAVFSGRPSDRLVRLVTDQE